MRSRRSERRGQRYVCTDCDQHARANRDQYAFTNCYEHTRANRNRHTIADGEQHACPDEYNSADGDRLACS